MARVVITQADTHAGQPTFPTHPSLLIFQVQRRVATVSLSPSPNSFCSQRFLSGSGFFFFVPLKLCAMCPILRKKKSSC